MSAIAALLPDGRLHLQHGPIDCVCQAWGQPTEIQAAYSQAATYFATILQGLCDELPLLRQPLPSPRPQGPIAQAMHTACIPFASLFITPMAAVAGAVADAVLNAMCQNRNISKAFVNNGGDIACHLAPGMSLRCGLVTDLAPSNPSGPGLSRQPGARARAPMLAPTAGRRETPPAPSLDGIFLLTADHSARGLATSGRACKGHGGRSFSFGIADSVTVLARTAARADAAATVIGNAIDLPGHPAIDRRPASAVDPNSDLGDRLITFDVGQLSYETVSAALDVGEAMADKLLEAGLIEGAVLALRGYLRIRHKSLAHQEVA